MWHVLPSSNGENRELLTDVQDLEQNQSDFKYEATVVRISALDGRAISVIYLRLISFSLRLPCCFTRISPHRVKRNASQEVPQNTRKRGKGCSPLGRGDLLLLLLLMWYLLLYHILQLKLFPFYLPRRILVCHLYIVSHGKLYSRACTATWL